MFVNDGCLWRDGRLHPILYRGRDYGLRARRFWKAVMIAPSGRLVLNPLGEMRAIQLEGDSDNSDVRVFLTQRGYQSLYITINDIVALDARESDYGVQGFSSYASYIDAYRVAYPKIKDESLYRAYQVSFSLKNSTT